VSMSLRNQLLEKFTDKEYRDNFVQEYIFSRIPLKIKSMRDARDISQQQLGQMAGIAQPWVSKLEDPNYGRSTLSTLLKIASAFDVALHVDFVPFSEILNRSSSLSEDAFAVPSYANDSELAPVPAHGKDKNTSETSDSEKPNVRKLVPIDQYDAALKGKEQEESPSFAPPKQNVKSHPEKELVASVGR
jgi:transcriptional regulator with XRE-family HTH domain